FSPLHPFLFRRPQLVGRFPRINISGPAIARPRRPVYSQSVIAVGHNFGRETLVADNGIAFPLNQAALRRVRHKTRVSLEIGDDSTDYPVRRIDLAVDFELFQFGAGMGTIVNADPAALTGQFP